MGDLTKGVFGEEDDFSHALIKSINKIVEYEKYTSHTIHKRKLTNDGGNYLSVLYEVDIKGETNNGYKETNIFVKQSLCENEKNIVSPGEILLKEIFVYIDLANVYNALQDEANIPDKQRYNIIHCYNDDANVNALILDNMVKKGYKIWNRFDVMTFEAMELSVRELAKFHALSMALKINKPDFFRSKIETLPNPFKDKSNTVTFITSMFKLDKEHLDEDKMKKVENFLPVMLDKFFRYLNGDGSRVKCLCHGDYRMGNILVKEIGNEVIDVIPIDYQIIHYGNPLIDLLFLIFLSTDRQFRKDNMQTLKKIYYETLAQFLEYFNVSLESIYSWRDFEAGFNEIFDYGLMVSLIGLPLIFVDEDEVPEFSSQIGHFNLHDGFKKRLEETIDEFTQLGYL